MKQILDFYNNANIDILKVFFSFLEANECSVKEI